MKNISSESYEKVIFVRTIGTVVVIFILSLTALLMAFALITERQKWAAIPIEQGVQDAR